MCPDNLATGSQITKRPGAAEFLCHEVQCKEPFLVIQRGSRSSYQIKAMDSMQRNNPAPRSPEKAAGMALLPPFVRVLKTAVLLVWQHKN